MIDKNIKYELIARYMAGECSNYEIELIGTLIKEDPEFESLIHELHKIWKSKPIRRQFWELEATWQRLSMEMEQAGAIQKVSAKTSIPNRKVDKSGQSGIYWLLRIAAIFLIAGLTGLFAILYFEEEPEEQQVAMKEVATERGQRSQVRLSDSSTIQLNAESRLTYPASFDVDSRTVHLSGEAYFDIAQDGRPFYVYANEAVIQILGTEFNVQAYKDEDIQVTVAEGRIAVRHIDASVEDAAYLEEKDMALLRKNGGSVRPAITHNVNLSYYLGWLDRRYTFEDASMKEVVPKLERWYGIEISLAESEINELRITATFEGDSIQEVLRVIELALDLDYEKQGRKVLFARRTDE